MARRPAQPNAAEKFLDDNGYVVRPWYRFLSQLWIQAEAAESGLDGLGALAYEDSVDLGSSQVTNKSATHITFTPATGTGYSEDNVQDALNQGLSRAQIMARISVGI